MSEGAEVAVRVLPAGGRLGMAVLTARDGGTDPDVGVQGGLRRV